MAHWLVAQVARFPIATVYWAVGLAVLLATSTLEAVRSVHRTDEGD